MANYGEMSWALVPPFINVGKSWARQVLVVPSERSRPSKLRLRLKRGDALAKTEVAPTMQFKYCECGRASRSPQIRCGPIQPSALSTVLPSWVYYRRLTTCRFPRLILLVKGLVNMNIRCSLDLCPPLLMWIVGSYRAHVNRTLKLDTVFFKKD